MDMKMELSSYRSCTLVINHQNGIDSSPEIHKIIVQNNQADLSNLRLKEIPKEVLHVFNLKVLKLNNNNIDWISPTLVSETPNLEVFEIDKNWIEVFPKNIGNWTKLVRLSAAENGLKNLPLSFCKMSQLRYLNLRANPLEPEFMRLYEDNWNEQNCREAAGRTVYIMREARRLLITMYPDDALEILRKHHMPKPIVEPVTSTKAMATVPDAFKMALKDMDMDIEKKSPESEEIDSHSHSKRLHLDSDDEDMLRNDPFAGLEQEVLRDDLVQLDKKKMKLEEPGLNAYLVLLKFWCIYTLRLGISCTLLLAYSAFYLTIVFAHFMDKGTIHKYIRPEYAQWIGIKELLEFHEFIQNQMIKYNYPHYFPIDESRDAYGSGFGGQWWSWLLLWTYAWA